MTFKVTFQDEIMDCSSEINAYESLLAYLRECVKNGDVTAFEFKEVK